MPLETALELAKDDTGLEILDNFKTIRTYLCEMKLLEHNPRLTLLIEEKMQKGKILFNTEKVEPSFLNDYVTDNCSELISIGQLVEKSDILTTLDRFCETMHFRLPKTTLS